MIDPARKPIWGVVPAAGHGRRLGGDRPKILTPIVGDETVWSILKRKLAPNVDHVHVVLSPGGQEIYRTLYEDEPNVSLSVQQEPSGMGDAIFGCASRWAGARDIVVVWGDQVHLSQETLRRALAVAAERQGRRCVVPLVEQTPPYVQYCFDEAGRLVQIRQSREGDRVDAQGWSDVGIFVFAVEGVVDAWNEYVTVTPAGRVTGEVNFLPFLSFLSVRKGWRIERVVVGDPLEARGINTPEDLRFFRQRYAGEGAGAGEH